MSEVDILGMVLEALKPLLSLSFWFSSFPGPLTGIFFWAVVGVAAGSLVLGVVLRLGSSWAGDFSVRRLLRRLAVCFITVGALVWLSFFFTQTSTPMLGSRFWFLAWLVLALVWLGYIVRYAVVVAPKERAARAAELAQAKYLPRRAN